MRRLRKSNPIKKPNVVLPIEEYNEDWSKLLFIMIQVRMEKDHKQLYGKYHQYRKIVIVGYV